MNDIDINGTKQLVADFKERHAEKIGANRKRGENQGTWADGESFERIIHGTGGFADEAAAESTGTAAAPRYEYVSQTPPVVGPPIPDDIDTCVVCTVFLFLVFMCAPRLVPCGVL